MCSAATPHCSSTGVCVECTESGQCPATSPVCSNNVCAAAPPACVERLLFFRGGSFGGQLYQIGLDDLTEKPILDGSSGPNATYSPDGKKIALVRSIGSAGIQTRLWIVDVDGQNAKQLDDQGSLSIFTPAWSPDGTKIAYSVQTTGDPTQAHIWVSDLDGNKTNLTPGAQAQGPRWSPDGTQILFTSNRTGNLDVFTMSSDGSNQRNLTNRSTDDREPAWSPDGNNIIFDYAGAASHFSVWRMNADGSNAQMITSSLNGGDGPAAWISNQQLVYVHGESGMPKQLYVTSPQGTNQHAFSSTTNTYGQDNPAPSRNGRFVAWSESDVNQYRQIWYSSVMTVVPTKITSATHDSAPLDWQACP